MRFSFLILALALLLATAGAPPAAETRARKPAGSLISRLVWLRARLPRYERLVRDYPKILEDAGLQAELQNNELETLISAIRSLEDTEVLPPFSRPADQYTDHDKRTLHIRKVAFSLWIEINKKVPWSIRDFKPEQLQALFSYDAAFNPKTSRVYLKFVEDVDHAYRKQLWLGANRRDTIVALGEWIRKHVQHRSDNEPYPDSIDETLTSRDWGTCEDDVAFMSVASAALNIPALASYYDPEVIRLRSHSYLDYPADGLFLFHGDDFYSGIYAQVPAPMIFAAGQERDEALDAIKSNPGQVTNLKTARETRLYFQFSTSPLLMKSACMGAEAIVAELTALLSASDTLDAVKRQIAGLVRPITFESQAALLSRARKLGYCK